MAAEDWLILESTVLRTPVECEAKGICSQNGFSRQVGYNGRKQGDAIIESKGDIVVDIK